MPSKPALRPMMGDKSMRLPPIGQTVSTMASPRPPPAPTEHPRTKGFFRVSRVSEGMTAAPVQHASLPVAADEDLDRLIVSAVADRVLDRCRGA